MHSGCEPEETRLLHRDNVPIEESIEQSTIRDPVRDGISE